MASDWQMIVLLMPTKRRGGLFPLVSSGRRNRFARNERRAGLLGQLARFLGGTQQGLRNLLQVRVFQMRNSY